MLSAVVESTETESTVISQTALSLSVSATAHVLAAQSITKY